MIAFIRGLFAELFPGWPCPPGHCRRCNAIDIALTMEHDDRAAVSSSAPTTPTADE
jgi:hypothetical protein